MSMKKALQHSYRACFQLVRLRRIERPHPVPETGALSTELQARELIPAKSS